MTKLKGGEKSDSEKRGQIINDFLKRAPTDSIPPDDFPFFYSSNIEELTGTEFSIYHTILEDEFIG